MKKIGFLYVKGTLPMFEDFGNLPTHIVRNNGMINGFKIHKELDGLIIPGGSIIESQSVSAVSYTHLDVYKRQHLHPWHLCEFQD